MSYIEKRNVSIYGEKERSENQSLRYFNIKVPFFLHLISSKSHHYLDATLCSDDFYTISQ